MSTGFQAVWYASTSSRVRSSVRRDRGSVQSSEMVAEATRRQTGSYKASCIALEQRLSTCLTKTNHLESSRLFRKSCPITLQASTSMASADPIVLQAAPASAQPAALNPRVALLSGQIPTRHASALKPKVVGRRRQRRQENANMSDLPAIDRKSKAE